MEPIKTFLLEPTGDKTAEGFTLYRRSDTGEVAPFLNNAPHPIPVGAVWECTWLNEHGMIPSVFRPCEGESRRYQPGEDGKIFGVRTPGGTWVIDSRCSNCTLPMDNVHKCWVRHGAAPDFNVDKNGVTCNAGAGSIRCGNWHGYLRNGFLVE